MTTATIDDATKDALNHLTEDDVSGKVNYAYRHEIRWYGIDAVAHVYLMQKAKDIVEGRLSSEDFIRKYDLRVCEHFLVRDGGSLVII